MKLYPGGEEDSEVGYAAVELANRSNTIIKIQWGLCVRDLDDKVVVHNKKETDEFGAYGSEGNMAGAL